MKIKIKLNKLRCLREKKTHTYTKNVSYNSNDIDSGQESHWTSEWKKNLRTHVRGQCIYILNFYKKKSSSLSNKSFNFVALATNEEPNRQAYFNLWIDLLKKTWKWNMWCYNDFALKFWATHFVKSS